MSELFSPYYKYCAEQTACQQYCKEQDRDNQVFKAYLAVSGVVVVLMLLMLMMWQIYGSIDVLMAFCLNCVHCMMM